MLVFTRVLCFLFSRFNSSKSRPDKQRWSIETPTRSFHDFGLGVGYHITPSTSWRYCQSTTVRFKYFLFGEFHFQKRKEKSTFAFRIIASLISSIQFVMVKFLCVCVCRVPFLMVGGLVIVGDRTDSMDSAFFYGRAQVWKTPAPHYSIYSFPFHSILF